MVNSTHAGHGGKNNFDMGAGRGGRWERTEVVAINNYWRKSNPNYADTGDVVATNVNQNLINIVNNTNKVSSSKETTYSHHMNAFNGKATGCEVWYYAGDEVMRKAAAGISRIISKELGIVDRGAKATTSLYVVSQTNAHCLLIEWCFVDNPSDMAKWDKNKVNAMNAVMKYVGMKTPTTTAPKPDPVKPPAKKRTRHSVMVGTFAKGGAGHKEAIRILKSKGMKYNEYFKGNNVWIRAIFGQNSTWKQELERTWESKNWNYVTVLEGLERAIIDNWGQHL